MEFRLTKDFFFLMNYTQLTAAFNASKDFVSGYLSYAKYLKILCKNESKTTTIETPLTGKICWQLAGNDFETKKINMSKIRNGVKQKGEETITQTHRLD